MAKKPVVLIIRDGWGENPGGAGTAEKDGNAILLAETPYHDEMAQKYPRSFITASGEEVGLPEGQMGNSEVGHLNLGAGRIVYQDLTRINKSIRDGDFGQNPVLKEAFAKAGQGKTLHLLGLVSDGGVHSHLDHLIALVKEADAAGVEKIMIHAITDGRDTAPKGGKDYLQSLEEAISGYGASIPTVVGRYFAMDRDCRWERVKLAWDAIVHGQGELVEGSASEAVADRYEAGETDEFIKPIIRSHAGEQRVKDGDVVLFYNFRADRVRELTQVFLNPDFAEFETGGVPETHLVTMTEYDETYTCPIAFPPEMLSQVLGEVVAKAGLKQLRIAETEKYPHVSYFFNGGIEETFSGEDRKVVPSPKEVDTYDQKPEMSSFAVEEYILENVADYDLVIVNFANPDMVGHTGVVEAAKAAVTRIDAAVRTIAEKVLSLDGQLLITADHGNAELMVKPDGSPHTAHTTFPVHCWYVANDVDGCTMKDGILADISPTLLKMLGLSQPSEMTGQSLLA